MVETGVETADAVADAVIELVVDVNVGVAGAALASMEGEAWFVTWFVAVNCMCTEGQ